LYELFKLKKKSKINGLIMVSAYTPFPFPDPVTKPNQTTTIAPTPAKEKMEKNGTRKSLGKSARN